MLSSFPHGLRTALALLLCAAAPLAVFAPRAQAQSNPQKSTSTPDLAPVAGLQYESVFSSYRAFGDAPLAHWRTTNDTVRQVGGWRAYAQEAQAPEPKDSMQHPPKPSTPTGAKP